jgi:hypothetical protein
LAALLPTSNDRARLGGRRHRLDIVIDDSRLHKRLGDNGREQLHMGPADDLGHDAHEAGMTVSSHDVSIAKIRSLFIEGARQGFA